jgi:NADH-quinone oxidoreductase subunit M
MSGPLLLSLTWLLPLASALALAAFPADGPAAKRFGLIASGANLALIAGLAWAFASAPPHPAPGSAAPALAFAGDYPWLPALGVRYHIGVDAISMGLMLLAAVIVFCGTLASWGLADRPKAFFILLQLLAAGTFGSFIAFDLFAFFVFNELTLIPTYLLIALFGSGRKEYAAMKLALMLLGGSALILAGILGLYWESGLRSFDIAALAQVRIDPHFQMWGFPALFLGFAVLGNLFPFHIWSPDGHASAPTAISMFLAGVHMKLGSYGCLRIAMYLMPEGCRAWMDLFLVLAAAGALWGAIAAVKQRDLKYMNAYSSVSHCALVFLGLAALDPIGLRGAVMQMLAHGFVTAAVFCLIGMIYARTHTRLIPDMSGLMARMPFLGVGLVIAGFAALGLPGLAGFAAELNIFLGGFAARPLAGIAAAFSILSIVASALYVLRATNAVLHGPLRVAQDAGHGASEAAALAAPPGLSDADGIERAAIVLLLACILAMGLMPGPIASLIDEALRPILVNLAR